MKYAFRSVLALLCLFCAASAGFAQNTNSGDIRGTVMDSSGAAVAGATVTLANIDTGEVKDFVTNSSGIYDTVSTRPGNYTITFSKDGFKKTTHGPIVLQVSIITVDATLEVGRIQEDGTVRSLLEAVLREGDRKSTRLNSSHQIISYAVFCLKK